MDGIGQDGAGDGRMEPHHPLHDRCGEGDLIPGNGAMHLSHACMEPLLHGIRFVNSTRGQRRRHRFKALAGMVLLTQEPGRSLNPVFVWHGVSSSRADAIHAPGSQKPVSETSAPTVYHNSPDERPLMLCGGLYNSPPPRRGKGRVGVKFKRSVLKPV